MRKPYFRANDFAPCKSPGYLLRRTYNQMLKRAEQAISQDDLTFTQWLVLVQMREGLVKSGADICRVLSHDSGATTRLLDQLEERGYIERRRSTEDRRVATLVLTARGLAMTKVLTPRAVDFWNDVTSDFTHAEIDTLMNLLQRLLTKLEQGDAPAKPAKSKVTS
jgi:DNA-binding MarR family transcriptional regulator